MTIEEKAAIGWIVAFAVNKALANHHGRGFDDSEKLANRVAEDIKLYMPIHLLKANSDEGNK